MRCSIDGCDNPVLARGWCNSHYLRWYRRGNPEAPARRARSGELAAWLATAVASATPDACIEWPFKWRAPHGYGRLTHEGVEQFATHVALAMDGRERPSTRHGACHSCDNPPCVNPYHLRWGTQTDNIADMVSRGRNTTKSKLTKAQAAEIKRRVAEGERQADLAREFSITPASVCDIVKGRSHRTA